MTKSPSFFLLRNSFYPIAAVFLSFCSCSSPINNRGEFIAAYQNGGLPAAEITLSKTIDKELPNQDFTKSKDSVWLLLDRATTRFAMGNVNEAISDYNLTIDAIDYYDQNCNAEALGKFVLDDEIGAYAGEDYEQILARVYFALALLHKGDTGNAFALLRQSEEIQQDKRDLYAKSPLTEEYELIDNSVAKYLFAAMLEKKGDKSNAELLYRQTGNLLGIENSNNSSGSGSGNNQQKYQENLITTDSNNATVIILCHNGNSPIKISGTSNASVASAIALEMILSANQIDPAWSSLTGIPVPVLMENWGSSPSPTYACLDGIKKPLLPWYDVAFTAEQQLQQKMPVIVARGVARFLLRRGAVAYAQNKDPTLGVLCDIGMLFANASTKADTRSWTTLPNAIDLTRFNLEPGEHALNIQVPANGSKPFLANYKLQLSPHDLCVINVFNIHPGITTVLIPQRFLINKGDCQ